MRTTAITIRKAEDGTWDLATDDGVFNSHLEFYTNVSHPTSDELTAGMTVIVESAELNRINIDELVDIDESFPSLPTIWQVFSSIRYVADELQALGSGTNLSQGINKLVGDLRGYGDYDEPLCGLIGSLLDGSITPENKNLLAWIAEEKV